MAVKWVGAKEHNLDWNIRKRCSLRGRSFRLPHTLPFYPLCVYIIIGNRKLYKNNKTLRSWHGMVCMWRVWVLACTFCVLYQRHGIISQISLTIHTHTPTTTHTYIHMYDHIVWIWLPRSYCQRTQRQRCRKRQGNVNYATLTQRCIYVNQLAFLFNGNNTSISYLIFYAKEFLFCWFSNQWFSLPWWNACLLAVCMHTYQQINTQPHSQTHTHTHHVSRSMMEKLLLWVRERESERERAFL